MKIEFSFLNLFWEKICKLPDKFVGESDENINRGLQTHPNPVYVFIAFKCAYFFLSILQVRKKSESIVFHYILKLFNILKNNQLNGFNLIYTM